MRSMGKPEVPSRSGVLHEWACTLSPWGSLHNPFPCAVIGRWDICADSYMCLGVDSLPFVPRRTYVCYVFGPLSCEYRLLPAQLGPLKNTYW